MLLGLSFTIAAAIFYFLTQSVYPNYKKGMELKRWIADTIRDAENINNEWEKTFGSLDDYPKRYPKTAINESAKLVESFAKELGVSSTYADDAKTLPIDPREADFIRIANSLKEFTRGQLARPDGAIDDIPEDLREYLKRSRGILEKLVQTLITEPLPAWEIDVERGSEAPMPPLRTHTRLQRLMTLLALQNLKEGQRNESIRVMDASWSLNQGLRTHPTSSSWMLSVGVERGQLGFFRIIRRMPEIWRARIAETDVRTMLRELFIAKAYFDKMAYIEARAEGETAINQIPLLKHFKEQVKNLPSTKMEYFDAAYLDLLRTETAAYKRFRDLDACRLTGDEFMHQLILKSEEFNLLIGSAIFMQTDSNRLNRLALDRELTQKVIQIEQAHNTKNHSWPAAIPDIESSICKDAHWIYEVSPDRRTMKIHFSKKLEWPGQKGLILPMEYSATIPAGK